MHRVRPWQPKCIFFFFKSLACIVQIKNNLRYFFAFQQKKKKKKRSKINTDMLSWPIDGAHNLAQASDGPIQAQVAPSLRSAQPEFLKEHTTFSCEPTVVALKVGLLYKMVCSFENSPLKLHWDEPKREGNF